MPGRVQAAGNSTVSVPCYAWRVKTAFTCFLLLITVPSARAQQAESQKRPFSIELSIEKDSLQKELFHRLGDFVVDAKITNISGRQQAIVIWTQPGWSWLSDNSVINPDTTATKNYPVRHVLRPGEVYSERLGLVLYPRTQTPTTFRLGFFATPEFPISDNPNAIPQDQVSWSNAVTLEP